MKSVDTNPKTITCAYIGNFEPEFSTENDVRKAFEHLGHKVVPIQENKTNVAKVRRAMESADMLLITGTWDSLPLIDMLDVFKECAEQGKPTATLHLDTFWGKSRNGRKWWREVMFHTAYLFTADGDYQDEWKRFGKNHIWLPPAVRHDACHFGTPRDEYKCDVAFVGSNGHGYHEDVWSYRRELVDALREMSIRNGWSFKNPGGDDPKIYRDDSMNSFYASAKVTVGDSLCLKKGQSEYWSDRQAEATGRAGFLIMPQINAINDIYGDSVPMYEWGDFKNLEDNIKYYLENEQEREEKKQKAHEITKAGHTYCNRVNTILKEVGLL